ncbi:MAG: amylo-alpha-1,6-glucosidase [Bacteroidales bacterium]|nr:amylo-alpha-1,6-glucosidase [Bacteroidales bacterium]
MNYISFDKLQLPNLEFSLAREIIRTNRSGSYSSSTVLNCHTRKYHGLLIAPEPAVDDDLHVLISSLDVSVEQEGKRFNLGMWRYKDGVFQPKGHKYMRAFDMDRVPILTYRFGNIFITRESVLLDNEDTVIVKYTVKSAPEPVKLMFTPFLAFRNVHFLTRANRQADTSFSPVEQGICMCLYQGYTPLYMQFSKETDYQHHPDWYYDIEYLKEVERGYTAQEDLLASGDFSVTMKQGESIYFSASTQKQQPEQLAALYQKQTEKRTPRDSFEHCLENAAEQFFKRRDGKTTLVSGYHYFGVKSRDTFLALPGLTLSNNNNHALCRELLEAMVETMESGLFPVFPGNRYTDYNAVDVPLLFIRAFQKYYRACDDRAAAWKKFGTVVKHILETYRTGTRFNIKMQDDGLIYAGEEGWALTWMNAVIDGKPVTQRDGLPVEVNALWYNAVIFAIHGAQEHGEKEFEQRWQPVADAIPKAFETTFWNEEKGYLADCVKDGVQDWSIRPNMIFAASLPHSPIDEEKRMKVVEKVKQELLTPYGIRTLSPTDARYCNTFKGNQFVRDQAYHNGIAFPFLLENFTEAYLRIYGKSGLSFIKRIYYGMEPELKNHGLATISEMFEPDPPYAAGGAITQATSVAALLRMKEFIDRYEKI